MSMFIDDIKIIGAKDSGYVQKVKEELITVFLMVDIDSISFYLGLKMK